ncbi:sorbosone dehydrogenase family protein [Spirosoma sp. 209]|uniref:PQQ-dependent sugar dehydrogenase n=1 Tax=Spirosoma sp. 209 TaxID=1955701 RepID=UPI00098D0CF9|nr:PQQ-dependent sugar dehydrogenase [Spirosoma sp. 209]
MRFLVLLWLTTLLTPVAAQTPVIQLTPYATGLFHPVDLAAINASTFLVGQANGQVRLISNGTLNPTPYLDIGNLVQDLEYNGIFGLCLHPNYASNGYLYVQYFRKSDKAGVVARYTRHATDPNRADPASALIILTIPYPGEGHRSGRMAFGPDGYLYITTGDSERGDRGSIGDPNGYAQNLQSPFGKLLRIDVNSGSPYAIPPTNPYASPTDGVPDALYALGLRNPWRWSFDRLTGDLWIADVGQDGWDELNFMPAGASAPQNYGWRCYEGSHPYISTGCTNTASFVTPLLDYPAYNNNGNRTASITGGFVYRGSRYPSLYGWYVYGDWSQGTIWTLRRNAATGTYQNVTQAATVADLVSFGEGTDGELYVLSFQSGTIYQIGTDAIRSVQSGNWHDPATWDCGCVPTSSRDVIIASSHRVTVAQVAPLRSLVLQGALAFVAGGILTYP